MQDIPPQLAVLETHPVQYHAPVYRYLQQALGIKVTAIYGSDFSVAGALDPEFHTAIAWDSDLLRGYESIFLSRVSTGGATTPGNASGRGMLKALRLTKARAVVLPGYKPKFYQKALFCSRRASCPIIFRGETTDHASRRSVAKAWIRDQALRRFYAQCSRLLYIGLRSREHFCRLGTDTNRVFYSPYCVDESPFQTDESARNRLRSSTRCQLGIGEEQTTILFSGKLIPKKGPDLLLEAVKQLSPGVRKGLVVIFLGSGAMMDVLRELAGSNDPLDTRFVGFQNQTQLSRYYHAADLLVLPSRHSETWGLVVNEALHHGLPCVVSSAVGCAPDLITEGITGEVCLPNSARDLAEAITRALALSNRIEIREKCRQRVRAYSVENAAKGIAQAYWSIANGARG
jgi:glycosyltransferase involved in cell wall biosynthesis